VNAVAATYAEADHAKVAVFHVTHHVTHRVAPGILPLRAHLAGVDTVPIIQGTVLLGMTSAVTVVPQRVRGILPRLEVKRF